MTTNQDHYQILGLVPGAEDSVIRAAYRALVAIYHPDKNNGVEGNRIRLINAAYDVLSDPQKRREYDSTRESVSSNATSSEFDSKNPFSSSPVDDSWRMATTFYRDIDDLAEDLSRISWRLSFAFKLELLENRKYSEATKIASRIKREYLSRYFGKNTRVLEYAEELIKAEQKEAALYLNEILAVMGDSVSIFDIRYKIEKRYQNLRSILEARRIYSRIKYPNGRFNIHEAKSLVEFNGGSVKNSFFKKGVEVYLNGEFLHFKTSSDFCHFVMEKYVEYS